MIKRTILVVNDVEATRAGIEVLLNRDGYRVKTARNEREAIKKACGEQTDLMLITLNGKIEQIINSAKQIRQSAGLSEKMPVIIFCAEGFKEPDETAFESNIYHFCPDNFNQLREFIKRLLT